MIIKNDSNFALVGHGKHICYFYKRASKILKKRPILITHKKIKHKRDLILNKNNKIYDNIFKLKGAKIYQINDFNSKKTIQILKKNNINYIFSFSSRFIFKKKIINLFKNKIINLHPSILPEERGAGTFTNRILNRQFFVCATFHLINEQIDSGSILLKTAKIKIKKDSLPIDFLKKTNDCYKTLTNKLIETIKKERNIKLTKQNNFKKTYFARYDSNINGVIDWNQKGEFISDFIRGFSKPYPGAKTNIFFKKKIFEVRIFNSRFKKLKTSYHPFLCGKIFYQDKKKIKVITLDGFIIVNLKDLKLNKNIRFKFEGKTFFSNNQDLIYSRLIPIY